MRPVDEALKLREGSANARWVLVCLATFADNDTGACWPSVPTLVDESGLADRTVRRAIVELEKMGLLLVTRSKGKGGNRYVLPFVANAVSVAALVAANAVSVTAFEPVDNESNAVNGDANAAKSAPERGQSGRRTYSRTDLELAATPLEDFPDELDPADTARTRELLGITRPRPLRRVV